LKGYAFVRNQIVHTGVTPSLREIGRAVGYGSPRSVQLMLSRLEKRGLISYAGGVVKLSSKQRSATEEQTVEVPLLGSVACGLPTLAEQDAEAYVQVSTRIARRGHPYFLLRAKGTSMNKSGINSGDFVLVRQQSTAEDGEKVVALVDGEATIKHLYHKEDVIILKPNSSDRSHQPIILTDEFLIQGVVVATLPKSII
jgi:repressor LexA